MISFGTRCKRVLQEWREFIEELSYYELLKKDPTACRNSNNNFGENIDKNNS
jgi:hypothetical protein